MKTVFFYLFIASALIIAACGTGRQPKSIYELQSEIWEETDTTEKPIYITGTKPVDSVDVNNLVFDIFRIEHSDYPNEIRAFARVYDSLGNFVTNMGDPYKKFPEVKYFSQMHETLGETYKKRTVEIPEFKVREFGANDSIPYNISLTVDYSGSMSAIMPAIFEGTEIFVNLKQKYDQIAISSFNKKFRNKVPLTQDKNQIINLYRAKRTQGFGQFSAVYDALYSSFDLFAETDSTTPRVQVVFTDGDDNYSKEKIGTLIERAKKDKIHIFAVAFGYSKDDNLRHLANYTGGKFYKAYTKEELVNIFRDIYMSLRYYYLISYKPPVYWGLHEATASLKLPGRADTMKASGTYNTSDLFDWDDLGKAFQRPILFEFDSATILPTSFYILDEITDALLSKPSIRLEIQGHTDNVGTIEYNQALSDKRAQAVMDALVNRGVEARRLRARGFGTSKPVAPNDSDENRAKNRRTEFVIIAK